MTVMSWHLLLCSLGWLYFTEAWWATETVLVTENGCRSSWMRIHSPGQSGPHYWELMAICSGRPCQENEIMLILPRKQTSQVSPFPKPKIQVLGSSDWELSLPFLWQLFTFALANLTVRGWVRLQNILLVISGN